MKIKTKSKSAAPAAKGRPRDPRSEAWVNHLLARQVRSQGHDDYFDHMQQRTKK